MSKLVNSILNILNNKKIAVANELEKKDPADSKLEEILNENTIFGETITGDKEKEDSAG